MMTSARARAQASTRARASLQKEKSAILDMSGNESGAASWMNERDLAAVAVHYDYQRGE